MVLRLVFGITIALLLSVSHAIAMQGVQGQGSSHPRLSVSLTGPGAVYAWPLPEAGFSAAATAGTHRPLTRSLPEVNLSTQRWFTSYRPDIRPSSDLYRLDIPSSTDASADILQMRPAANITVSSSQGRSVFEQISNSPGKGLLASLILPGLGQTANRQYWKAGLMAAVEVAVVYLYVDASRRGDRLQRSYNAYGDSNWSLVKYTAWVHNYYMSGARNPDAPDLLPADLLTEAGRAAANPETGFPDPAYNAPLEWSWVNREALNEMERRSRYTSGTNFTHEVNPFGSQQYYELMSKYWQFGPGWRDWDDAVNSVNLASNAGMSAMWLNHAAQNRRFNDAYKLANNMVSTLIFNHVISAFDAYFTIKMRQHRLETTARADYMGNHLMVTWRF